MSRYGQRPFQHPQPFTLLIEERVALQAKHLRLGGYFLILTAFFIAGSALLFVFNGERYVVYADGEAITIRGEYATVEEVISAAGVEVAQRDMIRPALSAPADPETAIAIDRAQQVAVESDGARQLFWTHARSLGEFLPELSLTIQRNDKIYADGELVPLHSISDVALPALLEIGEFLEIVVVENGQENRLRTTAQTVGDALAQAGIVLYAADGVEPPPGNWVSDGLRVEITRSQPYTIQVDGQLVQTRSHQHTPLAVLAEAGIGLVGQDYTLPEATAVLQPNATIRVVRVTEDFRLEDEPIPFDSLLQGTDLLEIDQRGLLQAGTPGILRKRIRVRYEDGVEVSQTPDGQWVAQEPVPEIVGFGTRIEIRIIDTENGPVEYWRKVKMRVTSYMPQTSGKPRSHPAYGITASGVEAGYGVVAIDRNVVPFRSYVYVPGYGTGFAGDTGGGVRGRWIDLGYPDDWDNFVSWNGYVDVYYLTPVPENINYLLPTALP